MARAEIATWLSLDRYAEIMGIHPMWFNQCYHPTLAPIGNCDNVFFQHAWQRADAAGREDIAIAIHDAERKIADYLGYPLIPDWITDERRNTVKPYRPELRAAGLAVNVAGFNKSVMARWGWIRSGGVRAKTLITAVLYNQIAPPSFGYVDLDGDGFAESVELRIATPTFDLCEVRLYLADPLSGNFSLDQNEIRPIRRVYSSGGITTFVFSKWQTLTVNEGEQLKPEAIDITGTVDSQGNPLFATQIEAWRVRNDPQTQVSFLWELPQCSTCGGSGCTACQLGTQTGCLTVRDTRRGVVTYEPATWNADDSAFDTEAWAEERDPDRLRLYYYAGWRDESLTCPATQMDKELERAVAYYATALMDRNLCGCGNVAQFAQHWRDDLAMSNAGRSYQNGARVIDNPFGSTRGALYAWDVVNQDGRRIAREPS